LQLDVRSAKVQQIRLHDCNQVQIQVGNIITGIILENCTNMRFVLPAALGNNNGIIHDFGWLRIDKPSPNFTIEYYHLEKRLAVVAPSPLPVETTPAALVEPGTSVDEAASHSHAAKTTTNNNTTISVDDNHHYSGKEESDDDDEL
jgi:hypothetical protein